MLVAVWQRSVLKDTLKMIPDCRKRLEMAVDDLSTYLVRSPLPLSAILFPSYPTLTFHLT